MTRLRSRRDWLHCRPSRRNTTLSGNCYLHAYTKCLDETGGWCPVARCPSDLWMDRSTGKMRVDGYRPTLRPLWARRTVGARYHRLPANPMTCLSAGRRSWEEKDETPRRGSFASSLLASTVCSQLRLSTSRCGRAGHITSLGVNPDAVKERKATQIPPE